MARAATSGARRPAVRVTSEGGGPRDLYNHVAGADDLLITVDRGSIATACRIGASSDPETLEHADRTALTGWTGGF